MIVTLQLATPFERHCERWKNGCGSEQCESARKVFARGKIPCGILLIGEAPGESEDALGYPFRGPAGLLQDSMLLSVNARTEGRLDAARVGFCNLVCCIPREDGKKAGQPDHEQILYCRPRLEEFIELCQPKLVVAVGRFAEDYLEQGYRHSIRLPESVVEVVHVIHPAAILKGRIAQQSLMKTRYVVTLTSAVKRHFN